MRPSELTESEFVDRFGSVYEASPWVAEGVWGDAKAGRLDALGAMAVAMRAAVNAAPRDQRLALIRAHPELASRAKMAEASVREQSGAGLDQCSAEEFEAFQSLNAAYNARFGFPFIVAVKGLSRAGILARFRDRLDNDAESEFEAAMAEIHRIATFRLAELF